MLLACSSGRSLLDSFLALTWILNLRVPFGFLTLSEVNVSLERRLIRSLPGLPFPLSVASFLPFLPTAVSPLMRNLFEGWAQLRTKPTRLAVRRLEAVVGLLAGAEERREADVLRQRPTAQDRPDRVEHRLDRHALDIMPLIPFVIVIPPRRQPTARGDRSPERHSTGSPAGAVGERSVDLAPLVFVLQVAALVEMVLAARQRDLDLGP